MPLYVKPLSMVRRLADIVIDGTRPWQDTMKAFRATYHNLLQQE